MKVNKNILLGVLSASLLLVSCNSDDDMFLTPEQRELIGKGINFEPYVDDFTIGTRAGEPTSVTNGGFNRGDMMYIYRQYANADGSFSYPEADSQTLPGTIYKYTSQYNGETNIYVRSSWKPYKDKKFSMVDGDYSYTMPKPITDGDSITWENGSTVRFRCWVLSSLCGNLDNDKNDTYNVTYPDYMVCNWVTVSGPTENIPMAMRHLGCRFVFSPFGGNSFVNNDTYRIKICTDWEDYMREDNADTDADDAADKAPTEEVAKERAAAVKAAYEKMCFPAGVDMDDMSLLACENGENGTRLRAPYTDKTHKHGADEMTADYIANNIRRPEFLGSYGSNNYMVTIPYDMSKENQGAPIVLPPYTRFRVYLRDVNEGDKPNQGMVENNYHIFSLSDVKKRDGNGNTVGTGPAFPDGITLKAGYSYQFYVGYHYRRIEVTAADNFSWLQQDLDASEAETQYKPLPVKESFTWWHNANDEAIRKTASSTDNYNPVFTISNEQEFQEFIDLVNGNFKYDTNETPESLRVKKGYVTDPVTKKRTKVQWYKEIEWNSSTGAMDTIWIDKEDLLAEGYIIYNKYYPSDADRKAYSEEDVMKGPYSFYDADVKRNFVVNLNADLDLSDWNLESIGKDANAPFAGNFNGNGHILKNVYMRKNGSTDCLFGNAINGYIKNLRIESVHPISIVKNCEAERILGCSIAAPSTSAPLAQVAKGECYFVGCSHIGDTTYPLVGSTSGAADDYFYMYGCMHVSSKLTGGALSGAITGRSSFLVSQGEREKATDIKWDNFCCNYYDVTVAPTAKAVTGYETPFHRMQYIRGVTTNVLCAKNDYLVDVKTDWWGQFNDTQRKAYYGVAAWRAMNYGIHAYNSKLSDEKYKVDMHYANNSVGYDHRYPLLLPEAPVDGQWESVTDKYN